MVQGFSRHFWERAILRKLLVTLATVNFFAPALRPDAGREQQSLSSATQTTPPIDILLEPGKPIEREIEGSQTHAYRIPLSQGEYVRVVVEQQKVDIVLKSFKADNELIAESDSRSRPEGGEQSELVAATDGSYKFQVELKYKMLTGGPYKIRVEELRAATENDRLLQQARELYTKAFSLILAGKYSQAEEPAQQALEIREKIIGPKHPDIAFPLTLLANIAYYKGNLAKAELLNQRAVTVLESTLGAENPQTATRLNNLASVYQAKGDWAKAETLHRRALEIRERILPPDHPDIAQSLNNLANVYLDRGDYASAEPLYLRAIAINEKILGPEHPNLAYPLLNLGLMHSDERDYDQAEAFFRRALAIREAKLGKDHPGVALVLQNLAELYISKGDYVEAEGPAQRALAIQESKFGPENVNVGRILNTLGHICFFQKDYTEAEKFYRRALAIKEAALGPYHPDTLAAAGSLARLYMVTGDSAHAMEFESRAMAGEDHNIDLNLALGSERQKQAYLASLPAELDRAISLHVGFAPDDRLALDLAATSILRRKGRVLDAMSQSMAALRSRMGAQDQALLDRLSDITVQLARLVLNGPQRMTAVEHQNQIKIAEAERERLEMEISRRTAGFYQPTQPATLAVLQSMIPNHVALIELAVYRPFRPQETDDKAAYGEPRYVAYVLRREHPTQWKELGSLQEINRAIHALRQALRSPQREDVRHLARVLDQKVMQPLRPLLGDSTRLLISPDGDLSLVPFEALLDEQGRYLIERYSFTYLTSGRDLLRMRVARAAKNRPVVIADPFFGEPAIVQTAGRAANAIFVPPRGNHHGAGAEISPADIYFAPLSGTAREAETVRALFPEARILTGVHATKTALQQVAAPSILHIATHGYFLQDADGAGLGVSGLRPSKEPRSTYGIGRIENPLLRSGLALAGANLDRGAGDNGILTGLEASNLNLWSTKLVTLSACDTGVGEVRNGQGVYGLRRSFFLAGAETLVMSLWPVSDRVTREMMTAYYTGLKRGLGRGEALRQAELAMLKRKDRQHPFYWASFIQSGEWANLDGQR